MRFQLLITFSLFSNFFFAQWSAKNVFEPKVFIQNKGQYKINAPIRSGEILFGSRQDGLHYYFTKDAILIKHMEMEETGRREEEEEKAEFRKTPVEKWHVMQFVGAGEATTIESSDPSETKFHFGTPGNQTIDAAGFGKIVYKELYPKIDMEFEFPADKQGFKYTFVVHPGGDVSNIHIEYPLAFGTKLHDGNIVVESSFGAFIDHAPVSGQQQHYVASSFISKKKGRVLFNVGNYNQQSDLIIDPWTSTPTFSSSNNAYDVDWDYAGNCYVYGGTAPFQIIKFDLAGSPLWIYTSGFSSPWYYGDFAVDKNSGSAYIVDGFNSSGAQIIKINSGGTQVAINQGNALMQELWRILYDPCSQKLLIGGGGTSNPSYTGAVLDTSLAIFSPVDVINCPTGLHDMWSIAVDNNGFAYFMTAKTQVGSPGYDNMIYKVPAPTLMPIAYAAPTSFTFIETASVNYAPGPPNGFNGAVVKDTNLYLYDSYVLNRYSTITGALTGTLSVNGSSTSTMTYGGLTADGCGNVFAGLNHTIVQYDASFNPVATYSCPSMVYDVSLGNGVLYACGQGWASAIAVTNTVCTSPCVNGLGLGRPSAPEVNIFPNPTCDQLSIELPIARNASAEIINSLGQTVKRVNLRHRTNVISVSDLPAGVYSLIIIAQGQQIKKVVVKSNP